MLYTCSAIVASSTFSCKLLLCYVMFYIYIYIYKLGERGPSWFNDRIGEKLTVTKRCWFSINAIYLSIDRYIHRYIHTYFLIDIEYSLIAHKYNKWFIYIYIYIYIDHVTYSYEREMRKSLTRSEYFSVVSSDIKQLIYCKKPHFSLKTARLSTNDLIQ